MNERKRYVVGFAFGPGKRVALIRKTKPAWQAGKLNGIGGKVEHEDASHSIDPSFAAMAREFEEETSVKTLPTDWRKYLILRTDASEVDFFVTRLTAEQFKSLKTTTEEAVVARFCDTLEWNDCLPNLRWTIPMATLAPSIAEVVEVFELTDVVTEARS